MGALQLSPRWFIVPLFLGTFTWLGKFLLTIPRLDKLRTGFHQPLQDRRSRSVKEKPVLQQESLKSLRWATWSALAFYFLGRHFKPSDNLAFANAEESYILAAINGHFVVERFMWAPHSIYCLFLQSTRVQLSFYPLQMPTNQKHPSSDAINSAAVDAHCKLPSSLKK